MPGLPTGTVTLLFTDIEGSTRLLRVTFQAYCGHEVDTQGDAISAAVAAQRALFTHTWPEGIQLRVRIGLHTGEPSVPARATSAWTCIAPRAS